MHIISGHQVTILQIKRGVLYCLCAGLLFACAPQQPIVRPMVDTTTQSETKADALPSSTSLLTSAPAPAPDTAAENPPAAPREFRAAWVSTVANIDWPSRADLSVAQQKAEIDATLDQAVALQLNAIILQVRPGADAIYPSALEPWSEYLTGEQGRAPSPFYDPLQTWIDGAHKRGLELHAWFNPYRARHSLAKSALAKSHIANRLPEVVKQYGKFLWMDPGEPAAVQQTLDVMLDVVRRYDVDGVHIDDYFYPYPIPADANPALADNGLSQSAARPELDFPDTPSWNRYLATGGALSRADWRRQNVNGLIERIYTEVHRQKAWVKVGISPFGLPRPALRPLGISGFSQYDKLYADAELWFNKGWLDYFTPQLYWSIEQAGQAFPQLLDYWVTQNTQGRALWPGLYTSRIGDGSARAFSVAEIVSQIDVVRSRGVQASGHVHFSIAALRQNREGIASTLTQTQYATPALIPAMPWLDATAPSTPQIRLQTRDGKFTQLTLAPGAGKAITQYAIWTRCGTQWTFTRQSIVLAEVPFIDDAQCTKSRLISVTAIDRFGNESLPARMSVSQP